jgi:hypothetical protein
MNTVFIDRYFQNADVRDMGLWMCRQIIGNILINFLQKNYLRK